MTELTVRELTGLHGLAGGLFPALLVSGAERDAALLDFVALTHRRRTVHDDALASLEDAAPADLPALEALVGKVHATFRRQAAGSMTVLTEIMRQRLHDGTLSDATLADAMMVLSGAGGDEPLRQAWKALFGGLESLSNRLLRDLAVVDVFPGNEPLVSFTVTNELDERVLVSIALLGSEFSIDSGLSIVVEPLSITAPA